MTDITTPDAKAEYEADIQEAMNDLMSRRSLRKRDDRRAHAVFMMRRAYATVIADDVAKGIEPWHVTVEKYRLAMAEDGD